MKKNSIFKVVLLTILCVIVCTWIFTSIQYSGQLVEGDRVQVGLFDLPSYLLDIFRYFPYVLITTLSIGAFYGVMYRIPAYRVLLDRIAENFRGKENIFLVSVIVLISVLVSVTGLSFGMMFIFPFIISLVLLLGYNKLVAASVTVGSTIVGLLGTTVGTSSVSYINYILGTKTTDQILFKVILLVVGIVLLAYNVISYSIKTKNNTDKVLEYVPNGTSTSKEVKVVRAEEVKEDKKAKSTPVNKNTSKKNTKKKAPAKKSGKKTKASAASSSDVKVVKNGVSIWPLVILFDLTLIIILLGTFDWTLVNAKWPTDVLQAIRDFKIGGFPLFSKLLGDPNSLSVFGAWSLNVEVPCTIMIFAGLLAFVYGLKFDKFIEGIVDGIKKAIYPAIVMMLAYMVLVICTYHPFQLHIAKFFLGFTKGFNVITMTITAMFASLFNVESVYTAQSTLPYVTTIVTKTEMYPAVAVVFQAVYGLMMLIAPTSIILIGTLTYLEIPYTQWLKHIWKLFLELLVALIVIFFILVMVI